MSDAGVISTAAGEIRRASLRAQRATTRVQPPRGGMSVEGAAVTSPDPCVELVQTTDYYYHVRVRPSEVFTEFRTPVEAAETAWEILGHGCDVREGKLPSGAWLVECVLIPLPLASDGTHAEALTRQLVAELEARDTSPSDGDHSGARSSK